MENFDRQQHWENIYQTKAIDQVSWYQPTPETSLEYIRKAGLPPEAEIIDIGGGDSFLVDHLLEAGYSNLSVLDISGAAIERARQRLGSKAGAVKWIVSDVTDFVPDEKYDLWHDRAAFHFLTTKADIQKYLQIARQGLKDNGQLIMGTFSNEGPSKCSGIEIRQYSEESMGATLSPYFRQVDCQRVNHTTPSDKIQNFLFCRYRKKP